MKKTIIYSITILVINLFQAQVGIGTNSPEATASIDVNAPNKGVLIPRIALTDSHDVTTIEDPAPGLFIFNTVNSGSGTDAVLKDNFYFWNGVEWTQLADESTFLRILTAQKVPKLAGFWYKQQQQTANNPTGLILVNYDVNVPGDYNYNFSDYLQYNLSDPTQTTFKVNATGLYGMEGFSCILASISAPNETYFMETVIQRSTDGGTTWVDTPIISTVPYAPSLTGGLTIPMYLTGALQLNQNDLLRIGLRWLFLNPANSSYSNIIYSQFARSNALGVKYSAGFKATFYPQ